MQRKHIELKNKCQWKISRGSIWWGRTSKGSSAFNIWNWMTVCGAFLASIKSDAIVVREVSTDVCIHPLLAVLFVKEWNGTNIRDEMTSVPNQFSSTAIRRIICNIANVQSKRNHKCLPLLFNFTLTSDSNSKTFLT